MAKSKSQALANQGITPALQKELMAKLAEEEGRLAKQLAAVVHQQIALTRGDGTVRFEIEVAPVKGATGETAVASGCSSLGFLVKSALRTFERKNHELTPRRIKAWARCGPGKDAPRVRIPQQFIRQFI